VRYVIYGLGGVCDPCDATHDHPLNNIVEQYDTPDPEPTEADIARAAAIAKLEALGLTENDLKAILG